MLWTNDTSFDKRKKAHTNTFTKIFSQFYQIGKDYYWNVDRRFQNYEKLPYLHSLTKTKFLVSNKKMGLCLYIYILWWSLLYLLFCLLVSLLGRAENLYKLQSTKFSLFQIKTLTGWFQWTFKLTLHQQIFFKFWRWDESTIETWAFNTP